MTRIYSNITLTVAGFLAAVLWFDLMWDVQVIPYLQTGVPDDVVASISTYYRRVTTDASPMGNLVGLVMLIGITTNLVRFFRSGESLFKRSASVVLMTTPTTWALVSIVPAAVALGAGTANGGETAIYIFWAHVGCLAMIVSLIAVQALPDRTPE